MAELLRRRGAVLLRGALPREYALYAGRGVHASGQALNSMLERVVNDMPLCFADVFQREAGAPPPSYAGGRELAEFLNPIAASGMDRGWYYEGERNYKRWFWEQGATHPNIVLRMVADSIVPRIAKEYFGCGIVSPYQHNTVRYQRPDIKHLSYLFHQDGSYHSREAGERKSLTVWVPLRDAGEDAPNLQLYPQRLTEILPLPPGASMPYLFCDEELVLQRYGDALWAPLLSAGDVLMFDGFTVHRSHITDSMTQERQSADLRFYPAENPPAFVREAVGWSARFDG